MVKTRKDITQIERLYSDIATLQKFDWKIYYDERNPVLRSIIDVLAEDRLNPTKGHQLSILTSMYHLVRSYVDNYQFCHAVKLYNTCQSPLVIDDLRMTQPCGSSELLRVNSRMMTLCVKIKIPERFR
jgi:hypothetical protein